MKAYQLLPQPRCLSPLHRGTELTPGKRIYLAGLPAGELLFSAQRLQNALAKKNVHWEITASEIDPQHTIGAVIRVDAQAVPQAQGYQVVLSDEGILITAHDAVGAFYGVNTVCQILTNLGESNTIEGLKISDWPDFPVRGVMLDISRDKVYTLKTVLDLVDLLSSWKINQIQLYMEHTFAYQNHPEVWKNASPFTGEEILVLDAYCKERYIELVPNQACFGHLNPWLKLPEYADLAEVKDGFDAPWGHIDGPFSLCPEDPRSLELVKSMLDELLPHFSSRMVNVNCDETFDVGQGRSKEACQQRGEGRVYIDFVKKIYREVARRGFKMQFWGDIIVNHPDLIPELPKDSIALEWGYEAKHDFDGRCAKFAQAGIPFYVCPGTSAWCSLAGRTENAKGNLLNAAENGLKHGAVGFLNTDWGDRGHWQVLPVSYPGLAYGAAISWALEANRELDLPAVLNRYVFGDPTGRMGQVMVDLGNVYQSAGMYIPNSSVLFWALQFPVEQVAKLPARARLGEISDEKWLSMVETMENAISAAAAGFEQAPMDNPDAELIRAEIRNTVRLMSHATRRIRLAVEKDPALVKAQKQQLAADLRAILAEYNRIWLVRNRPGGLSDSAARFEKTLADYQLD